MLDDISEYESFENIKERKETEIYYKKIAETPDYKIHYDRLQFGSFCKINKDIFENSNRFILNKIVHKQQFEHIIETKETNSCKSIKPVDPDFMSMSFKDKPKIKINYFEKILEVTDTENNTDYIVLIDRFENPNYIKAELYQTVISSSYDEVPTRLRLERLDDFMKFLGIEIEPREVELDIDFQGIEVSKEFLKNHLKINLYKKSNEHKNTSYTGNRRSDFQTRTYPRDYLGINVLRVELVFRKKKLKKLGITKPEDLISYDWSKEAKKYVDLVEINPLAAPRRCQEPLQMAYAADGIAGYRQKVKDLKIKKSNLYTPHPSNELLKNSIHDFLSLEN